MGFEKKSENKCFGGRQLVLAHDSAETGTPMELAVYLPPQAETGKVPMLWYLSGLTCTWENVTAKAGAQRWCAEHGLAFVAPDTSPRGEGVPDDPDGAYDFGLAAGFYVDATEEPFAKNYRMYSYLTKELPGLLAGELPLDMERQGITGHSMGGHGALTIGMRHPDRFRSLSAFAPIVAPSQVPWGEKALGGYLGDDQATWAEHDATALVASRGWHGDILIDQGDADNFLVEQLRPEIFEAACKEAGVPLSLRMQPGYDHSYYFISSFIGDHVAWHAERLRG
ncbi:S-formylglutathione hydrolase [Rhodobium orientis]|uniref:S-formylglutathione hydrolase n=1 Tax=Rhodobium orientis TaxID=34017 RepID=A0A327JTG6_9HYPH|nr:S-formylglutathione hydrolase [Rhodobium orientis]MBB4301758.1 S-formylglutathione hydrolase [Rhodobium orientis]MBK5950560.1 S-formylglutathione hydrolase [Rhodobium orientis]RAI28202.1 S-formylglutathione hydrolase [Rhodobium orientis]